MIIKQAAQLRMLLLDMEQGLGLETLTTVERDILYAVEILSELGVCIKRGFNSPVQHAGYVL